MNDQSKSLLESASVDPDKVETVSHADAMPQAAQDGGLGTQAREEALGNLLAVIHGDGGHRALEVGTKQAAAEAEKIVAGLFAAPDPEASAREGGGGAVSEAELRDAITLILPMAKGYAAAHPVGSNQSYVDYVDGLIALTPRHEAPAEGAGEEVRAVLVEGIAHDLGVSIAALGHPVGMGLAPSDDACRKAASRILDRIAPAAIDALRARSSAPEAREGGQPVGQVNALYASGFGRMRCIEWTAGDMPEVGTKLYTYPAAPSADKLRIAVEALERVGSIQSGWNKPHRIGTARQMVDDCEAIARQALAALKGEG